MSRVTIEEVLPGSYQALGADIGVTANEGLTSSRARNRSLKIRTNLKVVADSRTVRPLSDEHFSCGGRVSSIRHSELDDTDPTITLILLEGLVQLLLQHTFVPFTVDFWRSPTLPRLPFITTASRIFLDPRVTEIRCHQDLSLGWTDSQTEAGRGASRATPHSCCPTPLRSMGPFK